MKGIFVLYYIIALFVPILFWVVLLNNANEAVSNRVWVYLTCLIVWGAAGWLSGGDAPGKWIGWSLFIGAIEASMLCFMF